MVQKQRRRGREVVRPVADADGGADGRQDRDEADVIVRREVLRRDDADAAALFDQVKNILAARTCEHNVRLKARRAARADGELIDDRLLRQRIAEPERDDRLFLRDMQQPRGVFVLKRGDLLGVRQQRRAEGRQLDAPGRPRKSG